MEQQKDKLSAPQPTTPFEGAEERMAEFAENFVQAAMWSSMCEKLTELRSKDDPESVGQLLAVEQFMNQAIQSIPALNVGDA